MRRLLAAAVLALAAAAAAPAAAAAGSPGAFARPAAVGDEIGDTTAPELGLGTMRPGTVGKLRRKGLSVPVVSDEAGTALLTLTAKIRGKRRLLSSFAGDLVAGTATMPMSLGVVEKGWLRGRERLTARLVVRGRDAAGNSARIARTIRFRPAA